MRWCFFVLLFLLTAHCGKNRHTVLYQRDPKWELADEIYDYEIAAIVFCQLLKKDKNLHVCESGWDLRSKKNIQVMHCGFFYYNELDVKQARELLLNVGNLYLTTINQNEKIRPFLEVYPFTPKNIEIDIFLQNRDGSKSTRDKLCVVSIEKGVLRYDIELDPHGPLITIYQETYEAAMEKISFSSKKEPTVL